MKSEFIGERMKSEFIDDENDPSVILCHQIEDILVGHSEQEVLNVCLSILAHFLCQCAEGMGNKRDYLDMRVNETEYNLRCMIEAVIEAKIEATMCVKEEKNG